MRNGNENGGTPVLLLEPQPNGWRQLSPFVNGVGRLQKRCTPTSTGSPKLLELDRPGTRLAHSRDHAHSEVGQLHREIRSQQRRKSLQGHSSGAQSLGSDVGHHSHCRRRSPWLRDVLLLSNCTPSRRSYHRISERYRDNRRLLDVAFPTRPAAFQAATVGAIRPASAHGSCQLGRPQRGNSGRQERQ